jgi:hypothetical protein
MKSSDPTVTVSCDGELVVFTDDANSPPTPPEVVTIPRTTPVPNDHPASETTDDRHNKPKATGKKRRSNSPREKKS